MPPLRYYPSELADQGRRVRDARRCSVANQKLIVEHHPVVPNDCSADTPVVVLPADDPTATRKEDELSDERGAVSVFVPVATAPSAARCRSVREVA